VGLAFLNLVELDLESRKTILINIVGGVSELYSSGIEGGTRKVHFTVLSANSQSIYKVEITEYLVDGDFCEESVLN